MKRVLVACGNGIATSTMVSMKIKDALKEAGINATFTQCKLMEIPSKAANQDVIVTTGKYDATKHGVPGVNAMSLLTGINAKKTLDEIIDILK